MIRTLFILFTVVIFSSCGSDSANADSETSASSDSEKAGEEVKSYEASHEAPFCKLWVLKQAGSVDDPENFNGRWFDLKCDGTFQSGHWQESTNSGQWSIDEGTMQISLLFKTPETIPANWRIQGGGGGNRILWMGNVPGNEKGHQLMLESESEPPVKK